MEDKIEKQNSGKHCYKVIVAGSFDQSWKNWLNAGAFQIKRTDGEKTVTAIYIEIRDQSELRGLLVKLWDLNQEIISVQLDSISYPHTSSSQKE